MSGQFNKGDVVQLKSGGPKMTVADIVDEGGCQIVHCRFFVKNNELKVAEFDESELVTYVAPTGVMRVQRC